LETSFERYHKILEGPQLFAMFLSQSYDLAPNSDKSIPLKMLRAAVRKGHAPAVAVLVRVLRYYETDHGSDVHMLRKGASYGSLLAWHDLSRLDSTSAAQAWSEFRCSTGYNQFYSPVEDFHLDIDISQDDQGSTVIHSLAARGDVELLNGILTRGEGSSLDAKNDHGETALYKACLTGYGGVVDLLCKAGANASVSSDLNGLTCLHWLFNFSEADMKNVACALLAAHANVDALAKPKPAIPNPHFPFTWPPGTPLHFAVFASSSGAVGTLLEHGADLNIRDGRDPYVTDDNVRVLGCIANTEDGTWSEEPDKPPLGFTPIDLAAAMHDHHILSYIRTRNNQSRPYDFTSADEEGYTPLHRLSYLREAKTPHGLRFWYPTFTGTQSEVKERMTQTIRELESMGGDIDRLTFIPASPGRGRVSGLTPLMIATTKSDHTAVEALLECGANANVVNADGRMALTLLPEHTRLGEESFVRIVELLVRSGADINNESPDHVTPLTAVTSAYCWAAFRLLISSGADITSAPHGLNVVARFMWVSSYDSILELKRATLGASITTQEEELLSLLKSLNMEEGPWLSSMDRDGGTLLHYAAHSGLCSCVRFLIDAKLEINCVRERHFRLQDGRPSAYSDIPALRMEEGTPLDVVERRCKKFLDNFSKGSPETLSEDGKHH
jgi:ankyrin repeat protein